MLDEITDTIERLRGRFEALVVRGIRAAGPDDLALLKSTAEEFERIGAEHLAGRIGDVVNAIEEGGRGAADALLRAQTSLRLFDRVLTLDIAADVLSALSQSEDAQRGADR